MRTLHWNLKFYVLYKKFIGNSIFIVLRNKNVFFIWIDNPNIMMMMRLNPKLSEIKIIATLDTFKFDQNLSQLYFLQSSFHNFTFEFNSRWRFYDTLKNTKLFIFSFLFHALKSSILFKAQQRHMLKIIPMSWMTATPPATAIK